MWSDNFHYEIELCFLLSNLIASLTWPNLNPYKLEMYHQQQTKQYFLSVQYYQYHLHRY